MQRPGYNTPFVARVKISTGLFLFPVPLTWAYFGGLISVFPLKLSYNLSKNFRSLHITLVLSNKKSKMAFTIALSLFTRL